MLTPITRRAVVCAAPALFGSSALLSACSQGTEAEGYDAVSARTWRLGSLNSFDGAALGKELVRYATLAPSSHNTQCWKFAIEDKAITILPDLSRRTPAVDPDDHHLFVSGLAGQRPDLVVRFGRGPTLPASLRRPVQAVLV